MRRARQSLRLEARIQRPRNQIAQHRDRGPVQAHVHRPPDPALPCLEHAARQRERDGEAGREVDERDHRLAGRAAGLACGRDEARLRLDQRVVARGLCSRPVLAVGAERAVDQPRIDRLQSFGGKAEPAQQRRARVGEKRIRLACKAADDLLAIAAGHVEPDAQDAAVERLEVERITVAKTRGHGSADIAASRLSLITSAPRSANCRAANGPAANCVNASTRTPSSGPLIRRRLFQTRA